MKKDFISMHVYDDGDIELKNVTTEEKEAIERATWGGSGNLYYYDQNELRDYLISCGPDADEIDAALKELETNDEVNI